MDAPSKRQTVQGDVRDRAWTGARPTNKDFLSMTDGTNMSVAD